jgi:hypothetical protein
MDGKTQRLEQLSHGGGHFAVTWDDYGPFQILAEFVRTDSPLREGRRRGGANLDQRPVACQRSRSLRAGARPTHDEVIIAVDQNA